MAEIRPFRCIRPSKEAASAVAALPYDVYDRKEAKEIVKKNPMSFLAVDRAETQFEDEKDPYAPEVYEQAARTLERWQQEGILIEDEEPCYYLYELVLASGKINHLMSGENNQFQTVGNSQCISFSFL